MHLTEYISIQTALKFAKMTKSKNTSKRVKNLTSE